MSSDAKSSNPSEHRRDGVDGRRTKFKQPAFGPYRGDPDRANRLYAARCAAGFRSCRQAASIRGWNASLLRAHETAVLRIDDEMIVVYATGFGVDPKWLKDGIGAGPPVDPVRAARFRIRIEIEGDSVARETEESGRRLRLARRMAGYTSVKAAAEGAGLSRTTLSAHENGQNRISPEAARFYAAAFACSTAWLSDGTRPSGLPALAESDLDALLALHEQSESAVREVIFALRGRPAGIRRETVRDEPYPRTRRRKPEPGPNAVPEVSGVELYRARQGGTAPRTTGRYFGVPPEYLSKEANCGPNAVVVAGSDGLGRMATLILDLDIGAVNETDIYAVVGRDGAVATVVGSERPIDGQVVGGRVCLVLRRYAPEDRLSGDPTPDTGSASLTP